ncbi:hypothetical protein KKC60_03240 [Patescibacteria group bacterium]|nr:hypothetical protein [Patescibacteria group bacterium]
MESQKRIQATLEKALAQDNLFQSYIFSGPRNSGRLEMALNLIKKAICHESELTRFSGKKISIAEVRDLKRKFSLQKRNYNFCLIDDYGALTPEAGQALLKILEEPTAKTHFIILTEDHTRILRTIISRCQVFSFNRSQQVDDPSLKNDTEFLIEVLGQDLKDRFDLAKKLSSSKTLETSISNWISLSRTALLEAVHSPQGQSQSLGKQYSLKEISSIVKSLEASFSLLQKNVNSRLILENIFLSL